MGQLRSVVLAGGGTGGHIYPLLAFADCLRRHDPALRITCLGTPKGLENELIPPPGYDLRQVPGVPAAPLGQHEPGPHARTGCCARRRPAGQVLDDVEADVVVGFGGYVSVPAYLAAWRRHTPIVIHEVNVPPGVANRLGMRFTKHVAVGFPHQPSRSTSLRDARVAGVPLRPAIADAGPGRAAGPAPASTSGCDPTCRRCSSSAPRRAPARSTWRWPARPRRSPPPASRCCTSSGARNEPVEIPTDLPAPYVTVKYLAEMELGYAAADLVLCRGGAMTCAEVTAVGLPAIYVPLPYGNGEQRRNALPVVEAGGGLLVDDAELTPDWIEQDGDPAGARPRRGWPDERRRGRVRPPRRRRGAAGLRARRRWR